MRRLKVWAKLSLGFGLVFTLMFISVAVGLNSSNNAGTAIDFATGPVSESMSNVITVNDAHLALVYEVQKFRDSESEEQWKKVESAIQKEEALMQKTEALVNEFPQLTATKENLPSVRERFMKYCAAIRKNHDVVAEKTKKINELSAAREKNITAVRNFIAYLSPSVDKDIANNDMVSTARGYKVLLMANEILEHVLFCRAEVATAIYSKNYDEEKKNQILGYIGEIKKKIDAIAAISSRPETVELLGKISKAYSDWRTTVIHYFDVAETLKEVVAECIKLDAESAKGMESMINLISSRVSSITNDALATLDVARMTLIIGSLLALFFGIVIAFIITKAITSPLQRIVSIAQRAGTGDLTIKKSDFKYDGKDEIGILVDAVSSMVIEQGNATRNIIKVAGMLSAEAQNLAAISEETNASMEEIGASVIEINRLSETNGAALEESNAGIEEMSSGVSMVAQSSSEGADNVQATGEVSQKAVAMVEDVIKDMNSVGKKSNQNEEQIRKLAESVEQISSFVTVITNIADQTNLLALNAAIEAARAGEAGRGFAVVADEVRKLAEESSNAAKNVSQLISSLQVNARAAIDGTVESVDIVNKTLKRAAEAQLALNDAIKRMISVNEMIHNIASVAEEQAASSKEMAASIDTVTKGMNEVGRRIESVQDSTKGASAASENVAKTAETLNQLAEELSRLLEGFKVDDSPVLAIGGK